MKNMVSFERVTAGKAVFRIHNLHIYDTKKKIKDILKRERCVSWLFDETNLVITCSKEALRVLWLSRGERA